MRASKPHVGADLAACCRCIRIGTFDSWPHGELNANEFNWGFQNQQTLLIDLLADQFRHDDAFVLGLQWF